MKKLSALLLSVIILIMTLLPLSASAVVVSLADGLSFNPGNTRWMDPEYNYAWLDQLFIRADSTSVTTAEIIPTPDDYGYSHTFDDFTEECDRYIDLYSLDENTLKNVYSVLTEVIFYGVTAMNLTDNFDMMCSVLTKNGIELPAEATTEDKMKIAVVYAAIEYDAVYALYGKKVDFPAGITLDMALVAILGELTGVSISSDTDSVAGLGVQAMKQYIADFNYIPISDNPSDAEVFYWLKVAVASENGYQIPLDKYPDVSRDDKEYVDYVYFASILESEYEVKIDPEALLYANTDEDPLAVHRLVLTSMLDEKGVAYDESATTQQLFDLACKAGYFPLENEFYSDVLKYKMTVKPDVEKIWFTPITLGDQLNGGDKTPLTIYLQGNEIAPGGTAAVELDTAKKQEVIHIEVIYKDAGREETALYEFTVNKSKSAGSNGSSGDASGTTDKDVLGKVQEAVNNAIPTQNEKASQIVGDVFSGIAENVQNPGDFVSEVLSTYSYEVSEALNPDKGKEEEEIFGYLDKLLSDVYETDAQGNIVTTKTYTVTSEEETTNENIVKRVTQAVAENPGFVAAPSGLIALGGLLGFMMNKKHKDSLRFDGDETDETE